MTNVLSGILLTKSTLTIIPHIPDIKTIELLVPQAFPAFVVRPLPTVIERLAGPPRVLAREYLEECCHTVV
ncbi:hypothetical protein [Methanoregula sp.]|jgi:hypothetical protein|uniref:hypothetical protein n=1 Tax=Methanoregula sp. TaxID=2052170 RepID=UPI00356735DC